MARSSRPVFLNLWQIRLPVAGVMSIAHRAAGVLLFLSIPLMLTLLHAALIGEQAFVQIQALLRQPLMMAVLFLLLWALMHHLLAGIRYLLIDLDLGVQSPRFRQSAWAVLVAAPLVASLLFWGLLV